MFAELEMKGRGCLVAQKPLACRLGLHETFGDFALVTSGVIRCQRCPWVENPGLADQLQRERDIVARYRGQKLSTGELFRRILQELPRGA
jgi:hypothetical protein